MTNVNRFVTTNSLNPYLATLKSYLNNTFILKGTSYMLIKATHFLFATI